MELVRDVPTTKMIRKTNRQHVPRGKSLIVGPYETRMTIPSFKIKRTGIKGLVVITQVPKLLVKASYCVSGEIALHIHNANSETKLPSYKTSLVGVLLYPNTKLSWDTNFQNENILENNAV